MGCHFLLQGIFPIRGLNPRLLLDRQILYHWATWEAHNRMKNPGTPYRLDMRADSLSLNEKVSHLSTSTSRGLFPPGEMRPDSPALCPEQLRFPNQTRKEPRFAWLNSRESPSRLSKDEKNTDVTSGTQNWLVYPKSTQDEAHFPFIESIAVSHFTSYTTSVLTSFTTIQRFPETFISSL